MVEIDNSTKGAVETNKLTDSFARSVSYLRLSLTDQCNLRCFYCLPRPSTDKLPVDELLSYEELIKIIQITSKMGIRKVRLTGGEPLLRRNVIRFIRELTNLDGIDEVRITTNGVLLAPMIDDLYDAGIRKINISLDTLGRSRYREITGADSFDQVWQGVESALDMGFDSVKLNIVAMKGINDDEFADFARLTLNYPLQVRFIEFMPMGDDSNWHQSYYISAAEISEMLNGLGILAPVKTGMLSGPARIFHLPDASGTIGFISPISDHFCSVCNRLRLTSEGSLRACLLTDRETDLKEIIRSGGSTEDIRRVFVDTIKLKPAGHKLSKDKILNCHGRMSRIGG